MIVAAVTAVITALVVIRARSRICTATSNQIKPPRANSMGPNG
jgi:hypothetical protein